MQIWKAHYKDDCHDTIIDLNVKSIVDMWQELIATEFNKI